MNTVIKSKLGVIARKCGMTRIFTEEGASIPVTVLEVLPNYVTQLKTQESEGYTAIQVTTGTRKANRVTKALAGHFEKANVIPGRGLWEFRLSPEQLSEFSVGQSITAEQFVIGQKVDVVGTTKGRGFAGAIARHHFSSQRATHGNSLSHNAPGSIGQRQSPGRVFKGKRMAGH
jgi:large subunit ribosomal protein L3